MKKGLIALAAAILLVLSGSAAWAVPATPGSITINDLTDSIGVTTSPGTSGLLEIYSPTSSGEKVTITGVWNGATLATGTGYALLQASSLNSPETGDPFDTATWTNSAGVVHGHISDFITVNVVNGGVPGVGEGLQSFTIVFESDGGSTFQSDLTAAVPGTANPLILAETGALQNLSTLQGIDLSGALTLQAESDIHAVPLPPSVLLLGSGLIGLVGFRRFRKN
jgi:hypothetical protein